MRGDLLGRFRESLCVLCTQGGEWQHVRSVRRSVSAGIRRCDTEVTVMMMMMMHAASSFSCSLRGALVIIGLLTSLYVCTFGESNANTITSTSKAGRTLLRTPRSRAGDPSVGSHSLDLAHACTKPEPYPPLTRPRGSGPCGAMERCGAPGKVVPSPQNKSPGRSRFLQGVGPKRSLSTQPQTSPSQFVSTAAISLQSDGQVPSGLSTKWFDSALLCNLSRLADRSQILALRKSE